MDKVTLGGKIGEAASRRLDFRGAEPWLLTACCAVLALASIPVLLAGGIWFTQSARAQADALANDAKKSGQDIGKAGATPDGKGGSAPGGESAATAATKEQVERLFTAANKESEQRVEKQIEHSKMLLDGLVALAGIYSVLLGITAFVTVKFSRDDAKDQIEQFRQKLKDVEQEYKQKINEIEQDYQSNFPQFQEMGTRMQRLLRKIELRLPSMDEWQNDAAFKKLNEADHQFIQDSEQKIAAISVFGLDRAASLKASILPIFENFARYYANRSDGGPESEKYLVRAVSYAERAIELSPETSEGYRQRGAIRLTRYLQLKDAGEQGGQEAKQCLESAEIDLANAVSKGTSGTIDAGAYYNLALVKYHLDKVDEGVKVSRSLLAKREKIPAIDRVRYLPSVYRNLAGYLAALAVKARASGMAGEEARLSAQSVGAITEGVADFEKTYQEDNGLDLLGEIIKTELKTGGDFAQLGEEYREKISGLLDRISKAGKQ